MENRKTYYQIRNSFLECYYDYCRHKISSESSWLDGEHEIGYSYDQFVDVESEKHTAYRTTIEKLMLEVIALICDGGRNKKAREYHQSMIKKLMQRKEALIDTIYTLPEKERIDFISDLELIGVELRRECRGTDHRYSGSV